MSCPNKQDRTAMLRIVVLMSLLAAGTADAQPAEPGKPCVAEAVPGEFIVKLRDADPSTYAAFSLRLQTLGLEQLRPLTLIDAVVVRALPGTRLHSVPPGIMKFEAESLREKLQPDIEYIQPNYLWCAAGTPGDPLFSQQWALKRIGAPKAWDSVTGSRDVIVGVIDSGIDIRHPDLMANLWTNPRELPNFIDDDGNGIIDDLHGIRVENGSIIPDPTDTTGHGTHVAGIIGAVGDNDIGVAGVNWRVTLMALRFLNSNNQGNTADAIDCLKYGIENGVRIFNLSWGGGSYDRALEQALRTVGERGILVVAAAGFGAQDIDANPYFPASYDLENILVVMASDRSDERYTPSNMGCRTVDVAAPGVDILSTFSCKPYEAASGTSAATPHVTGAAALLLALRPDWSATELKRYLLNSADRIPELAGTSATGGRLNVEKAVEWTVNNRDPGSLETAACKDHIPP